jgi:hypothetical protein
MARPAVPRGGQSRDIALRLEERSQEIREAAFARLHALCGPKESSDPLYVGALKKTVATALDFDLSCLGYRYRKTFPIPDALFIQARLAARYEIGLETVLRSYFAGYLVFNHYLLQAIHQAGDANHSPFHDLIRGQAVLFDRVIAAIAKEYTRESAKRCKTEDQQRLASVKKLLAGELLDAGDLAYNFDAHHLAMIAVGPAAAATVGDLAQNLDCLSLVIRIGSRTAWAWFGGRAPLDPHSVVDALSGRWPTSVSLAIGESGVGTNGWRTSHEQARAALPIVMRSEQSFVRYGDVALLSAALHDGLLAHSLRELYLAPLSRDRDGGATSRETLRAYFAAERNQSSAAAALRVSRQTVTNRLRLIEERLDRRLASCAMELDAALRLHAFENQSVPLHRDATA